MVVERQSEEELQYEYLSPSKQGTYQFGLTTKRYLHNARQSYGAILIVSKSLESSLKPGLLPCQPTTEVYAPKIVLVWA